MQIGDLVTIYVLKEHRDDEALVGIIINQVGVVDRWLVLWSDGTTLGHNGYTLEVICN